MTLVKSKGKIFYLTSEHGSASTRTSLPLVGVSARSVRRSLVPHGSRHLGVRDVLVLLFLCHSSIIRDMKEYVKSGPQQKENPPRLGGVNGGLSY